MILGQLIEFYKEKVFMEKFSCPKANPGPPHKCADNLAYLMLTTAKVLECPRMKLGPKVWPSIQLRFEPRTFGFGVEIMA